MSLASSTLRRAAALAGGAFVLGVPLMARWEQELKATGGPGIVALELAESPEAAAAILLTWGRAGRDSARAQTRADLAWSLCYGVLGSSLVELQRRSGRWPRVGRTVRWLPLVASACDEVENTLMLSTLRAPAPRRATVIVTRAAATTKFALLGATLLYAAAAQGLAGRSLRHGV